MNSQPLDFLPIWAVLIFTILILLLASEVGFRLGKFIQKRWPAKAESGVGSMVGAALALLGFLLAVVTTIAIGVYNDRRQLVVVEANAIGTTYLRAGYLGEPYRAETRRLLREYVATRLEALDPLKTDAAIVRGEQIHDELWKFAEAVAIANPGPMVATYVTSLNELINLHTERLDAELSFRVPPTVVLGLYGVAMLTMILIGYHNSYQETRNLIPLIIVVLILSMVFLLIIDLDRSHIGLVKIPQKALIDLQQKLFSTP